MTKMTISEIIKSQTPAKNVADATIVALSYAIEFGDFGAGFEKEAVQWWYMEGRGQYMARLAAAKAPKAPSEECDDAGTVLRCKVCGATGHAGSYPFSTLPGSGRCDDCV